jgi:CheY-like chemotaxis protein
MLHTMASVLVVDDDLDSRDAIMRFLKRAGHRVRCAGNGREALRVLTDDTPDVIILDAKMPEMDGVSFLEVIRCYLRWQGLPVLFVTAYPEGLHIRRGMELGVRKTFLKSNYELSDLLAHVEACAPVRMSQQEDKTDFPETGGSRLN